MHIYSICVVHSYSTPTGNIEARSDNTETRIKLTEAQCAEVLAFAERLYEQHQQRIAEEFARPLPALADFSEARDEVSF